MKGSFLRRNGSFGGRSKITQNPHQHFFRRAIVVPSHSNMPIRTDSFVVTRSCKMIGCEEGIISI